jgi:hypothetical protein
MRKINTLHHLSAIIGVYILAFFVSSASAATSPAYCESANIMKAYDIEYAKTKNVNASANAVISTLSDAFKVDAVLSRFLVGATNGKYIKEISKITALRTGYSINPKTLQSKKLVKYFKSVQLEPTSISSGLTKGYDRLALIVSVAGMASNLYAAVSTGKKIHYAKAAKDSVDIASALAVTKFGWQGLQTAFGTVAFLDYALNSFITQAYGQYDEYWWQSYRSYMDSNYPKMVTGKKSWATLMHKNDGGKAFEERLTEFWSSQPTSDGIFTPALRAAHYYKKPSPFQRDGLASSTDDMKKAFAARYYTDTLKTTLETYSKLEAEKIQLEAEDKLSVALESLCDYMSELKSLQVEVADLQEQERQEQQQKKNIPSKNIKPTVTSTTETRQQEDTIEQKKVVEVMRKDEDGANIVALAPDTEPQDDFFQKSKNYETCRSAADENFAALKKIGAKSQQVRTFSKSFFNRVREKLDKQGIQLDEYVQARRNLSGQISVYRAKTRVLSESEIAHANSLVTSYNSYRKREVSLNIDYNSIIDTMNRLIDNRDTMDCGQYAYSIKISALAKRYKYNHEGAYAVCSELKPLKVDYERSRKTLNELSCLASNGQLKPEYQNALVTSNQEKATKEDDTKYICGIDVSAGYWTHFSEQHNQRLTKIVKKRLTDFDKAYRISFYENCTKHEEMTPLSGTSYSFKSWWSDGTIRQESIFWRLSSPKRTKRWDESGNMIQNSAHDENGKATTFPLN